MSTLTDANPQSTDIEPRHASAMTRRQRTILLMIFIAMAILQIGVAGRQCLWVDEIFSLAIATGHSLEHPAADADPTLGDFVEPQKPIRAEELRSYLQHDRDPEGLGRVIRAVLLSDTSPPLYYILLYVWTRVLGTSDTILRLFSVICSLACFPFFADLARRIGGRNTVIPACLLFGLSPLGLYFSGEGRMYSLFLFVVVLTAWASLFLQQDGGRILMPLLWILGSAAGFVTHYFYFFPWAAMVVFLLLNPGAFGRRRLVICIFLIGVAVLPWYVRAAASAGHWRITQGWLELRPTDFDRFRAIRNHFLQFFSSGGAGLWDGKRWSSLPSVALFAVIAGVMAWRLRFKLFAGARLLPVLWFVFVCAAPAIIDLFQHTYFTNNPRYTFVALPAAYLLAAIGLSLFRRRTAISVLGLVLFFWSAAIVNIYQQRSRGGESFRDIGQIAGSIDNSSELTLVHSTPEGVLGVARYADGTSVLASWIQQLGNHRTPESIQAFAAGRRRILFVLAHPLEEPRPDERWLRVHGVVTREQWLGRIKLIDFRPRNGETFDHGT